MPKPPQLSITLKKGLVGTTQKVRDAVKGLGLRKIRQTVIREDSPQTQGKINILKHMVDVKKA